MMFCFCDRITSMSVKKYLAKLENLTGKKIIVTGGTSGIGLSIVKKVLAKGGDIVMLARNITKANEVKSSLMKQYNDRTIDIVQYDQSEDDSVIQASNIIAKDHHDFYALILNAGVFQNKNKQCLKDDIYLTIKTNYVGLNTFLNNLLPQLKEEHRFVFQGSLVAGWKNKNIKSLKDKNISAFQQYIISKSGVEALFYHYSQLEQNQFSFYLVEPGLTSTDIIRDFPTPIKQMGRIFLKIVSHSNDKAALTALLALQSSVDKNSFIVPRGLGTYMGYPKIKRFPHKRERTYLYDLVGKI